MSVASGRKARGELEEAASSSSSLGSPKGAKPSKRKAEPADLPPKPAKRVRRPGSAT
jgi:hypothetical protein